VLLVSQFISRTSLIIKRGLKSVSDATVRREVL
jgi:hypothetical protein